MDLLEKAEVSLFTALCRNQRWEEAVGAKLQEIEKAEKKAENKKGKQLLELEVAERKLKRAEKKRELEEQRVLKVQLRLAKRYIREARIFNFKTNFNCLKLFVFCVRPWRAMPKVAEARAEAGPRARMASLARAARTARTAWAALLAKGDEARAEAGPRAAWPAAATTRPSFFIHLCLCFLFFNIFKLVSSARPDAAPLRLASSMSLDKYFLKKYLKHVLNNDNTH